MQNCHSNPSVTVSTPPKFCDHSPLIKRKVGSTPAAADKFGERESCFQYIANVGALQKSHVLRFQNRIRNRIGDSEFDFTIYDCIPTRNNS